MAICLSCGAETDGCLCSSCAETVDIEKLCDQIKAYRPGEGENELWDRISSGLQNSYNFRNVTLALADILPSPRREYRKILSLTVISKSAYSVLKASRPWLYELYNSAINMEGLSLKEKNRIHGLVLDALFKDYRFYDAEKLATELSESAEVPFEAACTLAEFYTKTRRYEAAEEVLCEAKEHFSGDNNALIKIQNLSDDNMRLRKKAENGEAEYMPRPAENTEEIRKTFIEFLASLRIEAEMPAAKGKASRYPVPIPKDQYPEPLEKREPDFDSFVAFDLETTGRSPKTDAMIEIGAIRVVGGKITEAKEFTFQELVKPFKQKVSEEIQDLTGIKPEDVRDARQMWEVFPDFMKFVGDDILVGFNCVSFDSKFLVRAGRYSHLIMTNKFFDVMRYAGEFREQLGLGGGKMSLNSLSEKLQIENPQAHRALSDAVTTAKVYLKLRELDTGSKTITVDELLSGFEEL